MASHPIGNGGSLRGPVAITARTSSITDIFDTGTDNLIYQVSQTAPGGDYSGWRQLGGAIVYGNLAAVSWGPNRVDIFGRGARNDCLQTYWDGSNAWDQRSLGGGFIGDFAVVSRGDGSLDVFGRGLDNQLLYLGYDKNTRPNASWKGLGGTFVSSFSAVNWGGSRLDVFGVGVDNGVWQWSSDDGSSWKSTSLGGFSLDTPTAVSYSSGTLAVFVRDNQCRLAVKFYGKEGWTNWQYVNDQVATMRPEAVAWGDNSITVSYVKTDNTVWLKKLVGTDAKNWGPDQPAGLRASEPTTLHPNGGPKSTVFIRVDDASITAKDFKI